ncbi:MAG: haloacid dehalogenase [Desulfobacterales bacterium]|nr:haloacid dehalogenase [Desulfobacterales bacterium]
MVNSINPKFIAFDIDGVFADTMTLFLDIARDEYNIQGIKYEDIKSYFIEECTNIEPQIIEEILLKLVNGNYKGILKPINGAPEVITKIAKNHSPILFVTARHDVAHIYDWLFQVLPLAKQSVEVVATGSFEAKTDVLKDKNIHFFVEDRVETCFNLDKAGITPIVFKQPWNRVEHPFVEVGTWAEIELMLKF